MPRFKDNNEIDGQLAGVSVTVDKISYEDSLKYRDVPEMLVDIRNKAKEKKASNEKTPEEDSNSLENVLKAGRRPKNETKQTLDELFSQVVQLKQNQSSNNGSSDLISIHEVAKILDLNHDESAQYYKLEISKNTTTLILLVKFNPTFSSK